ncbi:hypothetical protein [Corynebacterium uterequi]|uniref:Uncharacterized protein n=1 Tax=Corynebacterium uterequi TaxID=1072256 RepID=A0A0G3HJK0_9CORY|nr:hypothetical protein [Corynebacterium uterequi]AKK11292.1 hypothetical protein CUTER_06515 [Corynebacterium uterequi]
MLTTRLGVIWAAVAVLCLLLVFTLRTAGLFLSGLLFLAAALFAWRSSFIQPESRALRTSIQLSTDDIQAILDAYDRFLLAGDADSIADRTLHRPALADESCDAPAITEFRAKAEAARRFIYRVGAIVEDPSVTTTELTNILGIADQRSQELAEAWNQARLEARRLGRDY